jgi:hypothetical protein
MRNIVIAIVLLGAFVSGRAHAAASLGVSFNDRIIYDTSGSYNPYSAGDMKADIHRGAYEGQPYETQGYAHAAFGRLGISTFAASISDGHGRPIVRLEELTKSYFHDTLTITSNSAPVGSTVRLSVTNTIHVDEYGFPDVPWIAQYFGYPQSGNSEPCLPGGAASFLTGTCYFTGDYKPSASLVAAFAVDGFQSMETGHDYVLWSALPRSSDGTFGVGYNTFTFYKDVKVGDTVDLNVRFEAVASQYNPLTYLNGFAASAFYGLNTANSYISLSSEQVGYAAASGHNYAAPVNAAVPELSTWSMMIFGFGAAGIGLRRRSRAQRVQLV